MGTLGALRGEEGARQRMGGEGGWGEPGHAGRGRRLGGEIPRGAPGDFVFLCLFILDPLYCNTSQISKLGRFQNLPPYYVRQTTS